jgi:hypothetical protein
LSALRALNACSLDGTHTAEQLDLGHGGRKMLSRWGCVAAVCFGLTPHAEAAERPGLVHRASCAVVRFYVAKFSASFAETWARSHGATEAEIEAARHCLKDAPAQTARADHWTAQ